ncbi:MAG: flavin reductase family protein [Pacificimonas sp.]|jgi:flavin reductase|nr:flavin reductase family protein [Pacificimonas sp.]
MTSQQREFRQAMAQLAAAVTIVTTNGEAGPYGLTMSAVCSVSDEPPTLLICVNRQSGANAVIRANGRFCVNVLREEAAEIATLFATHGVDTNDRFSEGHWEEAPGGSPVLGDAAASFECTVTQTLEAGTHSIFIGTVEALRTAAAPGALVYHRRAFHDLPAEDPNAADVPRDWEIFGYD